MPRQARIDAPGAFHHIICRGIERRNIFRDNTDRNQFLERLGSVLQETATSCFGWALIPNHFHLLLITGQAPIAQVMRRLLTGYVVTFNRRHRRCGRLFQNRYKSILCQEDTYLLELVRYIHLNPIRAGIVKDLKSLDRYPYTGHSMIMGKRKNSWQDTDSVLQLFGKNKYAARKNYRYFVDKGIGQGRNQELTGGGLLRSVGGWGVLKSMRRMKIHVKGDERILGDSDFVEKVLHQASEQMERRYRLKAEGWTLPKMTERVAEIFGIEKEQIVSAGKQPDRVRARSVLACWAVRDLGLPTTVVGQYLNLSKSAVSRAVTRGQKLIIDQFLNLEE